MSRAAAPAMAAWQALRHGRVCALSPNRVVHPPFSAHRQFASARRPRGAASRPTERAVGDRFRLELLTELDQIDMNLPELRITVGIDVRGGAACCPSQVRAPELVRFVKGHRTQ